MIFGRLPDRMCDREPAGVASELGRLVGSAPEGGVVEIAQVFEKVRTRVQTGIKPGDAGHAAAELLPSGHEPEAVGGVGVASFQACQ